MKFKTARQVRSPKGTRETVDVPTDTTKLRTIPAQLLYRFGVPHVGFLARNIGR